MHKTLSIIFATSLISGCGSHITQAQLDSSLEEVRSEAELAASEAALAVHECAQIQQFALRAENFCHIATAAGAETTACELAETWYEHCTAMNDAETSLVNPTPGVYEALMEIYRSTAEVSAQTAESTRPSVEPATEPTESTEPNTTPSAEGDGSELNR